MKGTYHGVVSGRHFAVRALVEDGGGDEGQHADDDAGAHTWREKVWGY